MGGCAQSLWRVVNGTENRHMTTMVLVLLTSSACFFASMELRAAPSDPSSTGSSTAEQAAREELVRRQEAQLAAERLLTQGEKLFYAGKYSEAVAKLEQGIKLLPRAPATEVDYNRALHGLTDSYTQLANAALHSGDIRQCPFPRGQGAGIRSRKRGGEKHPRRGQTGRLGENPDKPDRVPDWMKPPNSWPKKIRSSDCSGKVRS